MLNCQFRKKYLLWGIVFFLSGVCLSGCAAPTKQQVEKRYFWPMGDEVPRIEYIDYVIDEADLHHGQQDTVAELVLGKNKSRPMFVRPFAAEVSEDRVLVTDLEGQKVMVLDLAARKVRSLQNDSGSFFTFKLPMGVAADASGKIFVTDVAKHQVEVFGADEIHQSSFGAERLVKPTGIALDHKTGTIYVVDTGVHQVVVFDVTGRYLESWGRRGEALGEFNFPLDVAVDEDSQVYVLDAMNARVQVFAPDGRALLAFGQRGLSGGSFSLAKAIAVSPSGHIYVTDSREHKFVIFDKQGHYLLSVGGRDVFSGKEIAPGGFNLPEGIAVGPQDDIWVVDSFNKIIHRFQYLNQAYLQEHPVLPGQRVFEFGSQSETKK